MVEYHVVAFGDCDCIFSTVTTGAHPETDVSNDDMIGIGE